MTKKIVITVLDSGFIVQLDDTQHAVETKKRVLSYVDQHTY